MDDLLHEFLTETNESIDVVDAELVRFEQDPNNAQILNNVFRLVHTIKGTCGFIGLSRLEVLAHAAETLMDTYRDGRPVTTDGVDLVLRTIDRIKAILAGLEASGGTEPAGSDADLIRRLELLAAGTAVDTPSPPKRAAAAVVVQELERELRPGEVSLDELERAFRATEADVPVKPARGASKGAPRKAKANGKAVERDARSRESQFDMPTDPAPSLAEPETGGVAVSAQSIRVGIDTLDQLMTMVSELVLTRNQLLEIARREDRPEYKVPLQRLSNVTAELQDAVMRTRMQPIGNAWQKLPRIVRDLARELDKQIELVMVGADTELDRQVLELVKDPLTHMVRNAADHGLESPAARRQAGKPERGAIRLSAYHQGGHIIVEVGDDGRGLDAARIRAKAVSNGMASEADVAKMTDAQVHRFIFAAGFSTAAAVTSISGRGVGMDVVRNNIEFIGGTIDLRTRVGEGTTFVIKIPLTLAIVPALIVEAAGQRYAIPQSAVVELVRLRRGAGLAVERINETPVLRLRDKLLPLGHLGGLLKVLAPDAAATAVDDGFVAVMQVGGQTFGIVVDAVFHTEEIVVKPMASMLRHIAMFSGSTILGDGRVILIVDPSGAAQAMANSVDIAAGAVGAVADREAEEEQRTSLLLFRAGTADIKAVPVSLVTRIEELPVDQFEHANGQDVVQYRGSLMPLVRVDESFARRQEGVQPVLVFTEAGRIMGLIVDEIIDIVEAKLDIELASSIPGMLGTAIVRERATEIIDVGHYLPIAFGDWFDPSRSDGRVASGSLLFVDDSAFFRSLMVPVLQGAGYEVTVCASGSEALERLGDGRPFDVILSDIDMPDIDGFSLAEAVRGNQHMRDVPIIALSGVCTPEAIERGRAVGFSDYIAKFDRAGLMAALREFTASLGEAA
jgi:two-component system chemotaxis sensor kinase CheA